MNLLLDLFFLLTTSGVLGATVGTVRSLVNDGSTTKAAESTKESFINVSLVSKLRSVIIHVHVTPPDNSQILDIRFCYQLNSQYECRDADRVQNNSGSFAMKELKIGECYNVNISVSTGQHNGSYTVTACTKPKPPEKSTTAWKSCASLHLKIKHPKTGSFDGFVIKVGKSKTQIPFSDKSVNMEDGNFTTAIIQNLTSGTCYNVTIFTVSNKILSKKSSNLYDCTQDQCLGNQTTNTTEEQPNVYSITTEKPITLNNSTTLSRSAPDQYNTTHSTPTKDNSTSQSLSRSAPGQYNTTHSTPTEDNSASQSLSRSALAQNTTQSTPTQKHDVERETDNITGFSTEQTSEDEFAQESSTEPDSIKQKTNVITGLSLAEQTTATGPDGNKTLGTKPTQLIEATSFATSPERERHVTKVLTTKDTVNETMEIFDTSIMVDKVEDHTFEGSGEMWFSNEITTTDSSDDGTDSNVGSTPSPELDTSTVSSNQETDLNNPSASGTQTNLMSTTSMVTNSSGQAETTTISVTNGRTPYNRSLSTSEYSLSTSTSTLTSNLTSTFTSNLFSALTSTLISTLTSTSTSSGRTTTPYPGITTHIPLTPNDYNITFENSSVYIHWPRLQELYTVEMGCKRSEVNFSVVINMSVLHDNHIFPGDCCMVNVTGIGPKYFTTASNEEGPEPPKIVPTTPTSTTLNITWQQSNRSWVDNFTVDLTDSFDLFRESYVVICTLQEPSCSAQDFLQRFICNAYQLAMQSNTSFFQNNNGTYSLAVKGLRPWTTYSYNVTAHNKYGDSIPSVTTVQTEEDFPGPPSNISVTPLNLTAMIVSWTPPDVPNGVIREYSISYNTYDIQVNGNITMVTLSDLDCWTMYNVSVSASTSTGYGSDVYAVGNTTVYDPESRIHNVTLGTKMISLSFEMPCENPPVTIEYNISYTALNHNCTGNQVNITKWKSCAANIPCDLTGLFSNWDYYIQVQKTVENKGGPWSSVQVKKTRPAKPDQVRNLHITQINSTSLRVCWYRPCFINSDSVWYNISPGNITKREETVGVIRKKQCSKLSPLMPYTNYTVTVMAENYEGVSDPFAIETRTGVAKPNQPREVTVVERSSRRLDFQWLPPLPFPGPTSYRVTLSDPFSPSKSCDTNGYNETMCSIDDLEEFWNYNVTVGAITTAGYSQTHLPQPVQTLQSAPGPVSGLQVHPETNPEKSPLVFVQFEPPVLRERNGEIKAYFISCSDVRSQKILNVIKLPANNALTKHEFDAPTQVLLNISVFAETISNGTKVSRTVLIPQKAKDFPISQAIGGISFAFCVFVIVVVIVAILYKKQMYCFNPPSPVKEVVQLKNVRQPKKKPSVDNEDKRKNRPVKTDRFYQHVEIMARDSNHFFSKEYKELKAMAPSFSTDSSESQESRLKNRYINILPFDHSRVKLLPLDDEDGSDFINANYIPGYNSKREYIAAQGPLPSTKDDFWRMIWEQNVSVVVMLTQCVERGKRKCECYWPEKVKEPVYFGDLSIETENESHLPEYVLRTISIKLGSVKKYLKHFLYIAWPDMGVPSSSNSMIQLVKTVRSNVDPTMKGPITVHCSAGVGRTGTFIAVDILLHQLDDDVNEIDIFGDVLKLRNHRCNMVQTEDQYIFIHHCLSDYILALAEDTDEEDAYDGGDDAVYQNVPRR